MADGVSELSILIALQDEASAQMAEVADSVSASFDDITEGAAATSEAFDSSIMSMEDAEAQLADIMNQSSAEIVDTMLQLGVSSQEAAATIAEANAEIESSSEEASAAANSSSSGMGSGFTQLGVAAGIGLAAVSDAISDGITNAENWDTTSAELNQTLLDTGSSIPVAQVQAYATALSNETLFSQQDVLQSEELILSHKDLQGSYQSLTVLSADLATKMGTDLPSATKILTNALADPVAGINQLIRTLGVDLPASQVTTIQNFAKVGDTAEADKLILADLNGQVKGLATAAAGASDTGLTKLANQLAILSTDIGEALAPALQQLVTWLDPIIQRVEQWTEEHPKLTAAILLGTAALLALVALLAVAGIAFAAISSGIEAFGVVFAAVFSPIGLTIVATGLLLVAFGAQFKVIMANLEGGLQAIEDYWAVWSDDVNTIVDKLILAIEGYEKTMVNDMKSALSDVDSAWKSTWSGLSTFVQQIWGDITGFVKGGVNDLINGLNVLIKGLDSLKINIPAIGVGAVKTPAVNWSLDVPNIPLLAAGGIVTTPTMAIVGDAGPEAIIPLSQLNAGGGLGGGVGAGQNGGITINIQGGTYLSQSAATTLGNMIARTVNQQVKLRTTV